MEDLALLTKFRQDLHRIPELDFDLPETIAYVHGVLDGLSCEVTSPCRGCVAAFFDVDAKLGRPHGPATAIRADMDALPMPEESGEPFACPTGETAHACGHDMHTAMLLTAAKMLKENEDALCGTVKLMFQTAEETFEGAHDMLENGLL